MPTHRKFHKKCPKCGLLLDRNADVLKMHYKSAHGIVLSEGEAVRFFNSKKSKKKAPYTEGLKKNFNEVSGGLPSLGKRK